MTGKSAETPVLLDLREPYEFASGAMPNSVNIPWTVLPERLDRLDREVPIVTVCNYGYRSGKAAELLCGRGFTAAMLPGGLSGWKNAGNHLERQVPVEESARWWAKGQPIWDPRTPEF